MPQVAVVINDKTYRMACDEGQEQHLIGLAKRFDSSVSHLKESFGEIGDQRLTVMAGIMITDELVELQKKVRAMEEEVSTLRQSSDEATVNTASRDNDLIASLNKATERIGLISTKLTSPVKNSNGASQS